MAPVRHHDVIRLSPLTRSKRPYGGHRQRTESDPHETLSGLKSRSAAVFLGTVVCYRLGDSAGGGGQRLTRIQNDSDLAQGLADPSAAG
jgi:hypothetical protein